MIAKQILARPARLWAIELAKRLDCGGFSTAFVRRTTPPVVPVVARKASLKTTQSRRFASLGDSRFTVLPPCVPEFLQAPDEARTVIHCPADWARNSRSRRT